MTRKISRNPAVAQRWVLALASVASLMVALDVLVVSTALSTIRQQLGASIDELEWTVNAYSLSFAVLLITAFVAPLSLSLLTAAVPAHQRGKALGIYSGITGLAVLGGPVLGGAVTQGLAWQWVF
jgi:MFS family permease